MMKSIFSNNTFNVPNHIAYLVGEFPILSETFVYREIRLLQKCGVKISLFTLRRTQSSAKIDLTDLPEATAIYGANPVLMILSLFKMLISRPALAMKGLSFLLKDLGQVKGGRNKIKLVFQCIAGARLASYLIKSGISHLHVHFIHSPCQVAMYGAAFAGIPYTVTAHANDIFSRGELLLEKADRAQKVVTISDFNQRYFEKIGVEPGKVHVVRCLMDLPENASAKEAQSSEKFVVGSLGRLVPKKGFATLIRAFSRFSERHPEVNTELQIAGTGPDETMLKTLVAELKLEQKVKFCGALHPVEVFDWMKTLSCFALACEEGANGNVDGIPVVLMEAMACNVPVVSTRLSGIPELIIDGETGKLVEVGQVNELADTLAFVQMNSEEVSKLVQQAQAHLKREFSKEVNLERLMKCFEH